jgi:hypothetical protein
MRIAVDPGIVLLFGSEARATVLGVLANAGRPLTAYRVARITGMQVTKTVNELRRLKEAGFTSNASTDSGRLGWVLSDQSLGEVLRRRVRIVWSVDWDQTVAGRVRRRRGSRRMRIDLSRFRPNPRVVPNRGEFTRSREKDRILARMGLPTSSRKGSRR